jgi:hypothetical protein
MRTLLALLLLGSLGATAPAFALPPDFTQPFDVATWPSREAADLDGDGLTDVVQWNGATVTARMAGPQRTFTTMPSANFLSGINRLRVGDFDGDGDQDLVGLHNGGVELLVNQGGGTFGNPSSLPIPFGYSGQVLATGDLDGDGRSEIVVVAIDFNGINGDTYLIVWKAVAGGFALPITRPTSKLQDSFRNDLVVAKVDGDAFADVVFAGPSDGIAVHRGNGDGTLQNALVLSGVTYTNDVEVADVGGDGIPDLVVAFGAGTQTLKLFPGVGDGTFGAAQVLWTGLFSPWAVAVGDVDGGGAADVVVGSTVTENAVVLLRGEDGFASAQARKLDVSGAGFPIRIADMDGDGKLDVFAGEHGIYWGDADGTPGSWAGTGLLPSILQWVSVLDVSGDGKPDIVSTTSASALTVELGHGDGTFDPPIDVKPGSAAPRFGDVNGDGRVDAVFAVVGSLQVLFGTGTSACFSGEQSTPVDMFGGSVNSFDVGDVNQDGFADVVSAGAYGGLTGPGPPFLRTYLGSPTGQFSLGWNTAIPLTQVALATMNGDALPDLVGVTNSGTGLEVRWGLGSGIFGAPQTMNYAPGIRSFVLGRIDDGPDMDCVIVGSDASYAVALGASGMPQAPTSAPLGSVNCFYATLADVNADGHTDAIFPVADNVGHLELRLGDGSGALSQSAVVSTGYAWLAPTRVADLNGDALPDLVQMGRNRSTLHFNRLQPTVGVPPSVPPQASSIALSTPSPQRVASGLEVQFVLPDASPARIEVFDVTGRRLVRVEVGDRGAGRHRVTVPALRTPGIAFVRLTRGDELVSQRVAMSR